MKPDPIWSLGFYSTDLKTGLQKITGNVLASNSDIEMLIECRKAMAPFFQSLDLVMCVDENIEELLERILRIDRDFAHQRTLDEPQKDEMLRNVSRLFLNAMSMFRSLLDHSETAIKRIFGDESIEAKDFSSLKSRIYDGSLEYRIVSKLRNYCQHVGIVPLNMSAEASAKFTSIIVSINRNELLKENAIWNTTTRRDLNSLPELIPILPFIHNWLVSIREIELGVLSIIRKSGLEAANRIIEIRKRIPEAPTDSGLLFFFATQTTEKNTTL